LPMSLDDRTRKCRDVTRHKIKTRVSIKTVSNIIWTWRETVLTQGILARTVREPLVFLRGLISASSV
jgi:hypothetical protein